MGCMFSRCKKQEELNESFLITRQHCMVCNKVFSHNEFNKHIVKCNQTKGKNNNFYT